VLALRGLIKKPQSLPHIVARVRAFAGNHPDHLARRRQVYSVTGTNAEAFGNRLGYRELKFAGDFGHRPYYSKE
jgi:uncharacterized RmlC-like cupin family protein